MDKAQREFVRELRELKEKHGVVDHMFCSVDIDGVDLIDYDIGSDKANHSNVARVQRIIGAMEMIKLDILKEVG